MCNDPQVVDKVIAAKELKPTAPCTTLEFGLHGVEGYHQNLTCELVQQYVPYYSRYEVVTMASSSDHPETAHLNSCWLHVGFDVPYLVVNAQLHGSIIAFIYGAEGIACRRR